VVTGADVTEHRELEENRASLLAAGSLGPVEEELRMLGLEAVVALEVLGSEGAAEAMGVAQASEATEGAGPWPPGNHVLSKKLRGSSLSEARACIRRQPDLVGRFRMHFLYLLFFYPITSPTPTVGLCSCGPTPFRCFRTMDTIKFVEVFQLYLT